MADDLVKTLNDLFNQCQPDANDVAAIKNVLEVLTNSHEVCDVIDEQVTQELGNLFVDASDGLIARGDFISRIKQVVQPVHDSTSTSSCRYGELFCSTPPPERGQGDDIPWLRRRSIFAMSSFSSADISQPLDTSDSPRKEGLSNLVRLEAQNQRLQDSLQKSQEACYKMVNDHEIELAVMEKRLNDVKMKNKSLKEELKAFTRKANAAEGFEIQLASAHRNIEQLKDDLAKNKIALTVAKDEIYSLTVENEELRKQISAHRAQLQNEKQLLLQIEQLRADKQQILETYSDNVISAIPNFVKLEADNLEITPDGICCIPEKIDDSGEHVSINEELTAIKSNFLIAQDKTTMCDIPQLVSKHTQTIPPDFSCATFFPTSDKATSCYMEIRRVHASTQINQPCQQNNTVQADAFHENWFPIRRFLILILIFSLCLVFMKYQWTSRVNFIIWQKATDFFKKSIGYRLHPY